MARPGQWILSPVEGEPAAADGSGPRARVRWVVDEDDVYARHVPEYPEVESDPRPVFPS